VSPHISACFISGSTERISFKFGIEVYSEVCQTNLIFVSIASLLYMKLILKMSTFLEILIVIKDW